MILLPGTARPSAAGLAGAIRPPRNSGTLSWALASERSSEPSSFFGRATSSSVVGTVAAPDAGELEGDCCSKVDSGRPESGPRQTRAREKTSCLSAKFVRVCVCMHHRGESGGAIKPHKNAGNTEKGGSSVSALGRKHTLVALGTGYCIVHM